MRRTPAFFIAKFPRVGWDILLKLFQEVKNLIWLGSLLIFLGGFWLLNNLGLISAAFWDVLWPSFLILLGIKLVVTPGKWRRFWRQFQEGKKIKIE